MGIGTTAPTAKLHLETSGTTDIRLKTPNNNTSEIRFVEYVGGGGDYGGVVHYSGLDNIFQIGTLVNGTPNYVLNILRDNGNVGIGTTSPTNALNIESGSGTNLTPALRLTKAVDSIGSATGILLGAVAAKQSKGGIFFENRGVGNGKGNLYFATDNTSDYSDADISDARMTIKYDGNIGIGTTAPSEKLDVSGNARIRSIASGAYSSPVNQTSTGVLTTATSDRRFKKDIQTIDNALDKVMQMRGVTYNWIDPNNPKRMTGMIAQEVLPIMPELVIQNKTDGYYGLFYGETSGLLVEAIKQQQGIIELQDNRLQNLETGIQLDETGAPLENVVMDNAGTLTLQSDPNLIVFNPHDVSELTDRLSEVEAQVAIKADQSDLESLRNRFDELEGFVQSASMSAALMQDIVNTQAAFDQISALNASGSAQIAREITDTDVVIEKNLVEEGDLTVLGDTNLADLSVTGTMTSGLLTINGLSCTPAAGNPYDVLGGGDAGEEVCGATISTLAGPIRIQHEGLADVTFIKDMIRMDIGGNLIVHAGDLEIETGSIKGNDGIRGINVTVAEGSNQVFVQFPNTNDTTDYAIGITPNWYTDFKVTEKSVDGFRVEFKNVAPLGATFDWIVIE